MLTTITKSLTAFIFVSLLIVFSGRQILAQDDSENLPAPDYVTVRIFEARVPLNKGDMTDQLFKLKTAGQTSDEVWLKNLQKAYPGVEIYQLKTGYFRQFKSPKKGFIEIGDPTSSHTEVQVMTAYSIGDGTTPGTTLIIEVNDYGDAKAKTAIAAAVATHGIEAEKGLTYFFTNERMKIDLPVYTKFVHDGYTSPEIEKTDHFFIAAVSVENDKQRTFMTDRKADDLLATSAIKKQALQIPPALKGIWGKVTVRAEVGTDGKVQNAGVWNSSAPELNQAALAAARKYEFAPQREVVNIPIVFSIPAPDTKAAKPGTVTKKTAPAGNAKKPVRK